ncbi:MAG: sulfatase [Blastocatellales bacterium]|nr:sulfatase [Blastocatellales bacterium]
MKALALFCVLALAKIVALAGYTIPLSVWTPLAYLWQDAAVALAFAAIDAAFASLSKKTGFNASRISWALYSVIVFYAAINVAVVRVLATPITWPMMRAARGALSDSILHHATAGNLLAVAMVAAAGIALPRAFLSIKPRTGLFARRISASLVCIAVLLMLIGPAASLRIDTAGLDRNAVFTLAAGARRRAFDRYTGSSENWRASAFDHHTAQAPEEDISRLHGAAADRNVVMVVLESAGARYLKPYGADRDPMPNLTLMAQRGVLFENAYTVFPESIKTLYSILCARAPALDTPAERYAAVRGPSLASELKAAGYRTGLFHSGRFGYLGMEEVISGRGFDALEDAGVIGGERESSFGVDEASTIDRMLAWVDEKEGKFLIAYLPIAGHHPYDTPERGPFPEVEDADRYLNALDYADRMLGRLIDGLRARGLEHETLFVIFGDHGEAFGQHEGNYGHSLFLYEENVRVPYVIAAPGLWSGGVRVRRAVSVVDTAPTILDLLGIDLPEAFEGESMLDAAHRMALFATDYSLPLLGLRDGCFKFIYEVDARRGKLFDLCSDKEERRDLSAVERARAAAYAGKLMRWNAAMQER